VVIKKTKVSKPAGTTSSADGQRNYELMLVINPNWTDEKLTATTAAVSQFIASLGGSVSEVKPLGKRKLAYPIQHFGEGHYLLLQFRLKSASSPELENRLNITEEIIRYLLKNLE
jgi:small subunit ribosomal protein S6